MGKLMGILPFIESDEVKELAFKIVNEEIKGVKLSIVYPFLSSKDLNEIVDLLIEKDRSRDLVRALPFLSQEKINEIYKGIQEGKLHNIKEQNLYPFLGREKIKAMFNDLLKRAQEEGLDLGNEDEDLDVTFEDED